MVKELPLRSEIDDKYKWNLHDIYNSTEEWETDFQRVTKSLQEVTGYRGKLVSSGETLFKGLNLIMEIEKTVTRLYAYAHLYLDQDMANQKYQGLFERVQFLHNQVSSSTSFMVPEILTISWNDVEEFISENSDLELYRHLLEDILRRKEHYLSAEEERILAMAGDVTAGPVNIFSKLSNADLTFPIITNEKGEEVRLTHGRYLEFMQSKDRRVRQDAFKGIYNRYGEFVNTFSSILSTTIKGNIFFARTRNYNSALETALDDDNVPVTVYDNLINTVKKNLEPMYRYIRLRKKILNLDELHMYDIYTPLVSEIEMKIPYNQARENIFKGLQPLGDQYLDLLQEGFNTGWIDIYENRGKRSGAYSSGCYGVHPYVLLNYTDNLENVFTLAHEMGHAIHTYYSNNNQPFVYSNYKIFVAEVASTLNETLLINYLLNNCRDKTEKRYLINHYLEQFRGTVFRQTMFAEFEKIIHQEAEKGNPLTPEVLNKIYHDLNHEYYGPDMVIDEEINLEWARIPHFYYNFYVYKYATGFSAATALAERILKEEPGAIEQYLNFLKSGDSDYPINLLKSAGVDMTTSKPVESAINTFNKYVDQLESLS